MARFWPPWLSLRRGAALKLLAAAVTATAPAAHADPLMGDVAAAYSTAEATSGNPANAGFVDRTQFQSNPQLFKTGNLQIRYPGFAPVKTDDTGIGSLLSFKPTVILKVTPRLGIGGYVIPPLDAVPVEIKKKNIPVVLLGQLNFVDFNATGSLKGAAALTVGYKLTDHFAVGFNFDYLSIGLKADMIPSEGGETLATLSGTQSDANLRLGARFDPFPGRLGFGMAITVVSMHDEEFKLASPLLSGSAAADNAGGGQTIVPMHGILMGYNLGFWRMKIYGDAEYTHFDPNTQGYSLVALRKERKDLHDTLAIRGGGTVNVARWVNLLGGFRAEPAAVGAGSKPPTDGSGNGTIGFGTMEVAMAYFGLAPMTPYYQVGGGMQLGFIPVSLHHGSKGFYRLTMQGGGGLTYASLGIDAKGELPGAYRYQNFFIAGGMTLKI